MRVVDRRNRVDPMAIQRRVVNYQGALALVSVVIMAGVFWFTREIVDGLLAIVAGIAGSWSTYLQNQTQTMVGPIRTETMNVGDTAEGGDEGGEEKAKGKGGGASGT